jgi:hypothetical protein
MSSRAAVVRRLSRVVVFGSLWGGPSRAVAAESEAPSAATILMIAARDDPTATRIVAELSASGLSVTTVRDPLVPHSAREIERLCGPLRAVAVVEIDRAAGEVKIWTVPQKAGPMILRYAERIDEDSAVVGLRASEALRASLRDPDGSEPIQNASALAIPKDHLALAPRTSPSRFGIAAGLAFASGTGSFGGSWAALVSLHWQWTPTWGVELLGVLPLTRAEGTESGGSATLTFGLAGGGVRGQWVAASWCILDAGMGAGAATIQTSGAPNGGFSGATRSTWVATPYARLGYAVSIAHALRIRADFAIAVAVPRPIFTFAVGEGSWGEPLLLASIGPELIFR